MALPLRPGLTPPEIAFLCEMEMITVIPRQRLEGLELLGGSTPSLQPPYRATVPLWLALLLKRQQRANIFPPPWIHPGALQTILDDETEIPTFTRPPDLPLAAGNSNPITPPFVPSATASAPNDALPYHWLEIGEILLEAAPDDLPDPGAIRRLMRDLREVRMAKMRAGISALEGSGGVSLRGVGAMELGEGRAFITGVVDGLRMIGASTEQARKEREAEENEDSRTVDEDEDEDMAL
ncbi:MAG: DNA replication protein psf2 [Cirrosporium novae-zelandiae]|nr:MAG: DNA replication protein psf2 [Cirrosporium novae-zelandiae]